MSFEGRASRGGGTAGYSGFVGQIKILGFELVAFFRSKVDTVSQ